MLALQSQSSIVIHWSKVIISDCSMDKKMVQGLILMCLLSIDLPLPTNHVHNACDSSTIWKPIQQLEIKTRLGLKWEDWNIFNFIQTVDQMTTCITRTTRTPAFWGYPEDTPRRPMITHTIDHFILNPKSILLTSSYQISSQNKVKSEKLENLRKIEILEFCYKLNKQHTLK